MMTRRHLISSARTDPASANDRDPAIITSTFSEALNNFTQSVDLAQLDIDVDEVFKNVRDPGPERTSPP